MEDKEQSMAKRLEEDQSLIESLKEELAKSLENQSMSRDGEKEENAKVINELTEKLKILENNVKHKEELVKFLFNIFSYFLAQNNKELIRKRESNNATKT